MMASRKPAPASATNAQDITIAIDSVATRKGLDSSIVALRWLYIGIVIQCEEYISRLIRMVDALDEASNTPLFRHHCAFGAGQFHYPNFLGDLTTAGAEALDTTYPNGGAFEFNWDSFMADFMAVLEQRMLRVGLGGGKKEITRRLASGPSDQPFEGSVAKSEMERWRMTSGHPIVGAAKSLGGTN